MKTLKNKKINNLLAFVMRYGAILFPAIAFAQNSNTPSVSNIKTVAQLVGLMCVVFGWMFYILITLSIIMIVVAGFNYVTAGDNSEKVSKANKMILYASIGVAVALLAKGIPLIVGNFIGASGGNLSPC